MDIAIIWYVITLDVVSGAKAEVKKEHVRVHLCLSLEQGNDNVSGCKYHNLILVIKVNRCIQYVGMASKVVDNMLIGQIPRENQ